MLNKEVLKLSIYSDLSEIDTILEKDASTKADRVPEGYGYNSYPFRITNNDISNCTEQRGIIKSPQNKVEPKVDVTVLASENEIESAVSAVAADDVKNSAELAAKCLVVEREATVLADRVLQHLLDYLETSEAANSVVKLRELFQYLIKRLLDMTLHVQQLSNHTKALKDSLSPLLSMQTELMAMLTLFFTATQSGIAACVGAGGATFSGIVSAGGLTAGSFTQKAAAVAEIVAKLGKVLISSEADDISASTEKIYKDLSIDLETELKKIIYDDAINIS